MRHTMRLSGNPPLASGNAKGGFPLSRIVCRMDWVAHDATERESPLGVTARHLLERREHPILVEAVVPQVRLGVDAQLELATLLGGRRVDPGRGEPPQMVTTLVAIHDMHRLVAAREPILNEREQHLILFLLVVEERTHMTSFGELGAGKADW